MRKLTLKEEIEEAIDEAKILECARDTYDESHMLFTAMKLSGAPFSFVEQVFRESKNAFARSLFEAV